MTWRWQKRGLIFRPDGSKPWLKHHAQSPFSLALGGGLYRIYFSARDERNRAHIGFIEIDIAAPDRVLRFSEEPVLAPGPLGYFDDHGVYARCIVTHGGRHYLYYLGWNPGLRPPMFYSSIGLAISEDGGITFRRHATAPLLERSVVDPWCVLLPFVLRENGVWRMWYGSGIGWTERDDTLQSFYDIKYAELADGLAWRRDGFVCIPLAPGETNVAHPCVVRDGALYRMWYSFDAGARYRIGYAESPDGLSWRRRDDAVGIASSATGWDSEMICQPHVFTHGGMHYLLYNGNAHGRDGIGLAVAE